MCKDHQAKYNGSSKIDGIIWTKEGKAGGECRTEGDKGEKKMGHL